jgi:hypothetical protein
MLLKISLRGWKGRFYMIKQFMLIALTIAILAMGIPGQAQVEEPVIDPQDIFADGIAWTRIEPDMSPRTRVNSEDRTIEVFDGDNWQSFPYPPEAELVFGASLRPDGVVLVALTSTYFTTDRANALPEDVWLLDLQTGVYSRPPTVCEGHVLAITSDEWVVGYDDNQQAFLCHLGTGQMRDVLHEDLEEWRVFPSPDESYLILIARDWNSNGNFATFAYDVDADVIISLGSVSRHLDNTVGVCGWVSDTRGVLCAADTFRSWPGTAYYAFDVTRSDNLIRAFSGWQENIFQIDAPRRYVSLYSQDHSASITGGTGPDHLPCTLIIYDAEQLIEQEVGYECSSVTLGQMDAAPYYRDGNVIYFLTIESEDASVATLHRFDAHNLVQYSIFTGEIENVLGVSPDGHYIVLLMDDDRIFDFPWRPRGDFCCPESGGYEIVVLDTQTSEFLYRSEPIGVYASGQVVWLDEQSVVIAAVQEQHPIRVSEGNDVIYDIVPPSLRRITLNDDFSMDVVIDPSLGLDHAVSAVDRLSLNTSPDNRYWLRSDHTVVDLRDFETITLFREGFEDTYRVYTSWTPEGVIEVRVSTAGASHLYHITLP